MTMQALFKGKYTVSRFKKRRNVLIKKSRVKYVQCMYRYLLIINHDRCFLAEEKRILIYYN